MCEYINSIIETLGSEEETRRKLRELASDIKLIRPSNIREHLNDYSDRIRRLSDPPIDYDTWRLYEYCETYGTDYAVKVDTVLETPEKTVIEQTNYRIWLEENDLIPDCSDYPDLYEILYGRAVITEGTIRITVEYGPPGFNKKEMVYVDDTCEVVFHREGGEHDTAFFTGDSVTVMLGSLRKVVFLVGGKLSIESFFINENQADIYRKMAEIMNRFAQVVEVVKSKEPRLLPVLNTYKPELWTTRGHAEKIHYDIGLIAESGTKTVDTYKYTKWECGDHVKERNEMGPITEPSTEWVATRGGTRVTSRYYPFAHRHSISLQLNGQTMKWDESEISVSIGDSCIKATPNVLHFNATVEGAEYSFAIYEDGAEFAKNTKG
jgi:hypothetical protein